MPGARPTPVPCESPGTGRDTSQVSGAEDDQRGTWERVRPPAAPGRVVTPQGTRRCPRARRSRNRGRNPERNRGAREFGPSGTREIRGCTVVMRGEGAPARDLGCSTMRPSTTSPSRDARADTTLCDGANVTVLRWLFDLVVIVGYFATALVLGSWLIVAVPVILAAIVIAVTIVRVRLDEYVSGRGRRCEEAAWIAEGASTMERDRASYPTPARGWPNSSGPQRPQTA